MFDTLFSDGSLRRYLEENLEDPWVNTLFQGYVFLSPKQKGEFGERFVSKFFQEGLLSEVKRSPSGTAGHDRVIDGFRTEIKFSLAIRDPKTKKVLDDRFIMNHVSKSKDWERLVFCGVNTDPDNLRLFWFTKEDFTEFVNSERCCFSKQQGGKSADNDDYMCSNVAKLMEMPFVRQVTEW
jgi:hypothetical protein